MKDRQKRDYDTLCRRIDGMWWKIGVLAGIVSIIVGKVFGGVVGEVMGALLGM